MMQAILTNEYPYEEMVKEQVMKHAMMEIHHQMMDAIHSEHKLKTHGHALEVLRRHKTIAQY